jgi:Tol biopolymer transport system component
MRQLHSWTRLSRWAVLLSLPLISCRQSAKLESIQLPDIQSARESVVVDDGDSSQPSFSPDGTKLIFISRNRRGHTHAQVYEKDLKSGRERRITFQNGNTAFPVYHSRENVILYSSSTDELKENSPMLKGETLPTKLPAEYQEPYELYQHSLGALEITRLTHHLGFDGEARFTRDGTGVVWTRAKGETVDVMLMNRNGQNVRSMKGLSKLSSQFQSSANGKYRAWLDWDESFGVSRLRLEAGKNKPQELAQDMVVHKTDLTFSPDSKWLLWAQFNTQTSTYQLWGYEIEANCLRRFTANDEGDRRYPVISPDLKWLTFTAVRKARSRIMQVPFAAPAAPCVL